jgi:hypothetical protein
MGRPERPVDPGAGAVQGLAHALRELRRAAGGPSYRTMAKAAGFSATTLSQAAAGERLPTLAVVECSPPAVHRRPRAGAGPGLREDGQRGADPGAVADVRAGRAVPPYLLKSPVRTSPRGHVSTALLH